MIRKTVQKHNLDDFSEIRQNLEYWLSRPPAERLAAVDDLRRAYYGDLPRIQKVARVVQINRQKEDAADIEALEE